MRSGIARLFPLVCVTAMIGGCQADRSLATDADATARAARAARSPSAPSNLTATAVSASEIDLAWQDNSSNETAFEVYRSSSGRDGSYTLRATTGADVTNYGDTGLEPSTEYCYRVRARRTTGDKTAASDFSSASCDTTAPAPGPPAAPAGTNATPPYSSTVDITWVDNAISEDGLRLERSLDGGSTWTTGRTMGRNATSSSDYGLTSEQQHCYRVIAFNGSGDSPPSNADCTTPPAGPSNLTAAAADQQTIDLTWTDNSGVEDGYEVQRTDGVVVYGTVAHLPANSTSYRDVGVTSDITYNYKVRATKDGGGSSFSNIASAAAAVAPPSAPVNVDARPGSSTEVVVDWTDNSANEDGFRVERSTDGGVMWATVTSASPYDFIDAGRTSEHQVCYRVIAFNNRGDSPPSNTDCTTPPAGPTDLTATRGEQGVDLTWTDNSGVEDGYEVWVATTCTEQPDFVIANLPANSTGYRDPAPDWVGCWIVQYFVVAAKDSGYSNYSNLVAQPSASAP